jgi:hypothetical protein
MKHTLLTLIICFLALALQMAKAQTPNWDWAIGAGGTGEDFGYSTATDGVGNVYVTGYYTTPTITFGAFTLINTGVGSMFIVKYDASGIVLWAKNNIGGYYMTIDVAGNIILGGIFGGGSITFGTTTLTGINGYTDIYIVKCDSLGNVIWAKVAGGIHQDKCYDISTDISGNIYLTGSYSSPYIVFDGDTLTNRDTSSTFTDMFVVKYDTAGNVSWAKGISADNYVGNETGSSVTTDYNGNVYVTGGYGNVNSNSHSIIFGTDTLQTFVDNTFLAKYDALGNELWAKGPSSGSGWNGMINADAMSNVYVTGYYESSSSITFGVTTLPSSINAYNDLYVVKYDSLGSVIWAKSAGGSGNDGSTGSAIDADGNFYITGLFYSPFITFGAFTLNRTGSSWGDIFVAKYNATGNVVWAKKAGSNAGDFVNGISVDSYNNTYITGYYRNSLNMSFGQITLTNTSSANEHFYFAKLGCDAAPTIASSGPNTICNGDSVVLTASTAASYLWSNGDTTQTTTFNTTGSYYVTTTNGTCSVQSTPTVVTVNQTPSITSTTPNAICGAGLVTLAAAASGGIINWYSTANGGSSLNTGASFATPTISATTTYYVDATIGNCTTPIRTAVTAMIDTLLGNISAMGNTTFCIGDSIMLVGNNGGTWNNGSTANDITINATGNYYVISSNSCGSDTSNSIEVTVNAIPNNSVTQSNDTLTINQTGASYQWLDCDNNFAAIPNDTNQTFVASANGNYAVLVTQNGCVDTSACYSFIITGIANSPLNETVTLYPNPANSNITVSGVMNKPISIQNTLGENVFYKQNCLTLETIDVSGFACGIYFVKVSEQSFKMIKE